MMGAKYLVAYWQSMDYSATNGHKKLVIRFYAKAPAYSSVMTWPHRLHFSEDIFEPGIHARKPSAGLIDFNVF
jgi:hypothetical protein